MCSTFRNEQSICGFCFWGSMLSRNSTHHNCSFHISGPRMFNTYSTLSTGVGYSNQSFLSKWFSVPYMCKSWGSTKILCTPPSLAFLGWAGCIIKWMHVHSALSTVQGTQYTVNSTRYTVHITYTVYWILDTGYWILDPRHCTAVQLVFNPFSQLIPQLELYSQLQLSLWSDPIACSVPKPT